MENEGEYITGKDINLKRIDDELVRMMELNKNLPTLIQRSWDLCDEINAKIHYDGISFCKHCLEHGLCSGITETTIKERKRLIAIRDSLKDLQDMLVFLQILESRKQKHESAALARLEASRFLLVEKINQYPGQGGKMEVLEELNAWFGNRETAFTSKLKDHEKEKLGRKANTGDPNYVTSCIRSLFNPWNWYNTTKTAMKLVIISTVITSSVGFCRSRQQSFRSKREILSPMDPKMARKRAFIKNDASNSDIDVFYGRG